MFGGEQMTKQPMAFIPWKPGMPRPCNEPSCRTCDGDRAVLREYGEKRMRRWVNHERRKGLVR